MTGAPRTPGGRTRLLMLSGDRQVAVGERGPFYALLTSFHRYFERIDVLHPRPQRPVVVREVFGNVFLHAAPVGRPFLPRWIARRGGALIREHGHDLVVSHDYGWFYNGRGAARLSAATGLPWVSEIHHVPGHPVAVGARERLDYLLVRAFVRWANARVRAFRVVNTGELVPLLRGFGVPPERITVLPSLYIDLETFAPAPPSDGPVVHAQDLVFVGRLVANKGLDRIVEALRLLRERGRPRSALFIGKGPLEGWLERRIEAAGLGGLARRIAWVDGPAELARHYRASRALVCASSCEGGPRVTVEAMACGTPCVSTRVGMMNELLVEGENGVFCDFDAPSLADAVERLLGDEARRARMGLAARGAAEGFEREATIRRYAEGLQALARGEAPA